MPPTGKESVSMSIFPTKILLATDGSEDAELARTTAIDIALPAPAPNFTS